MVYVSSTKQSGTGTTDTDGEHMVAPCPAWQSLRGTSRWKRSTSVPADWSRIILRLAFLLVAWWSPSANGQQYCTRTAESACALVCTFAENNAANLVLSNDVGSLMDVNRTGRVTQFSVQLQTASARGVGVLVDSSTGRLLVNTSVDYEGLASTSGLISAVILANQTMGNGGTGTSTRKLLSCHLTINVTNVNERPSFPHPYSMSIPENSPAGTSVVQVMASDPDHDTLVYSIASHTSHPNLVPQRYSDAQLGVFTFAIDTYNGSISVSNASSLDYEVLSQYTLYVVATDGSPFLAVAIVTVNVIDRNEIPPSVTLLDPYLNVIAAVHSLAEGQYLQSERLGYFEVHDAESNPVFNASVVGADGLVQLHALFPATRPVGKAHIYLLSTVPGAVFDRELQSVFSLRIIASDKQLPVTLTGETNFTLTITDIDDASPLFSPQIYTASVQENLTDFQGHPVVQVHATDPDENDTIIYSIQSVTSIQSDETRTTVTVPSFYIGSTDGQVYTSKKLDYETLNMFELVIRATSSRNSSRYHNALVTVSVLDTNDNLPVFSQSEYVFRIREVNEGSQFIGMVMASDRDSGRNGLVRYSLSNTSTFSVQQTSGEIYTLPHLSLDREDKSQYSFAVFALDSGNPVQTSTARVQVIVSDLNDNGPEFVSVPSKPIPVFTNVQVGTTILRLYVQDPDTPENSHADFELLQGNAAQTEPSAQTYFTLRHGTNSSVCITVLSSLRDLGNETFSFFVKAVDPGAINGQEGAAQVPITVQTVALNDPSASSSSSLSTAILIVIILLAVGLALFLLSLIIVKVNLQRKKKRFTLQDKQADRSLGGAHKSHDHVVENPAAHEGSYRVRPESLQITSKSTESLNNTSATTNTASDTDQPPMHHQSLSYGAGNFPEKANSVDHLAGTPIALREVTKSKGRSRSVIYSATMGELDMELATPMDSDSRSTGGWNRQGSTKTVETQLGSLATTPSSGSTSRSGSAYFPSHEPNDAAAAGVRLAKAQSQSEYSLSQSRPQTLTADYRRQKQHVPKANGTPQSSPRKQQSSPRKQTSPRKFTNMNGGSLHMMAHKLEAGRSMYGSTPGSLPTSGRSTPNSLPSTEDLGTRTWSPYRKPMIERHHSMNRGDNPPRVRRHMSFNSRHPEMQV
ncbi:protocadherin Fat 4-like [Sycon ciliatum]|uniref:protocadherin Fat 4-like n=1 Tax=Sycon ciliatum TaxID=27933 RepID=UPI0031F68C0B